MFKKISTVILLSALGLSLSNPAAADATAEDFEVWGGIFSQGNFWFRESAKP
jgi:hypothetical protein